jgi:hypothetical protein
MTEALIIPFVIAQAFPAPMISEGLSQLFGKSRAGWARGTRTLIAPADPRHV